MIERAEIRGLFGLFSHEIPFNTRERITILHGSNGIGKTTVLKLIAHLFARRFSLLRSLKYRSMSISFAEGGVLTVKKQPSTDSDRLADIKFTFTQGKKAGKVYVLKSERDAHHTPHPFSPSAIEDWIPHLRRVAGRQWYDPRQGRVLSLPEIVDEYEDAFPIDVSSFRTKTPEWLKEILDAVPVHFIETQRLFAAPQAVASKRSRHSPETMTAVERYSDEMLIRMQEVLQESGTVATSRDRTFPHRLMESDVPATATELNIRNKYMTQLDYRRRLMEAGLIEAEKEMPLPKRRLTQNERKVLWHYLNDVTLKFKVFDSVLNRVELFKEIINKRFQYKEFSLETDRGFVFTSENGSVIPLTSLSSGEQHELVLAYRLLFTVERRALILIDEPELSLHISWQHRFLEDIEHISKLADLDFLIATHSPSIIHSRRDLMVALERK